MRNHALSAHYTVCRRSTCCMVFNVTPLPIKALIHSLVLHFNQSSNSLVQHNQPTFAFWDRQSWRAFPKSRPKMPRDRASGWWGYIDDYIQDNYHQKEKLVHPKQCGTTWVLVFLNIFPSSQPGNYVRTVHRTEKSFQACNDIVACFNERAKVEKQYAQQLNQWSNKWKTIVDSREYEKQHVRDPLNREQAFLM